MYTVTLYNFSCYGKMTVKITWDLSTVTSGMDLSVRIVTKIPEGGISTYILHLSEPIVIKPFHPKEGA